MSGCWGFPGVKCAHAIAGTEEALSAKEFRSFGTLNAIWGALIKLVVGVPPAITRALIDLEHQPAADTGELIYSTVTLCPQDVHSGLFHILV
jgi:hypothetical protein